MRNFHTSVIILTAFLTLPALAKDFISITAMGDVMMGTTFPANLLPENDGKDLFSPAKSWIEASDIRFINFEGTFFDGRPQPDGKSSGPNRYLFRTPTTMVSRLQEAQVNVASLANNHVKDFGTAGIISTKKTLTQAGIQYSSKAGETAEFKVDETEISLIAVDFYKAPRSITQPSSTYEEIRQLKNKRKLIIVSAHVGAEGQNAENVKFNDEIFLGENRGNSVEFAHKAIDEGADVIIMHGPHIPRGLELYKNRLIIYSLGNFITGKGISLDGNTKLAPLVRLQIDHQGNFIAGQIVSFIQQRSPQRIELDSRHTAMRFMRDLSIKQFPNSPLLFSDDGTFKIN